MSRIAYVGLDRQVHLVDSDGGNPQQLTLPIPRGAGAWGVLSGPQDGFSWPAWSPDGAWVACFAVEGSDTETGPVRVVSLSVDGVRQIEWAQLVGQAPIYVQWHPSSEAISVLTQSGENLQLTIIRRDRLGQVRTIDTGVPLFFNWTPDGGRVLVHVGSVGSNAGQLILRDPLGDAEDEVYDHAPGSFCAPVFPGPRPVYAVRAGDGVSEVVVSQLDGAGARVLTARRGLLALIPAPGGRNLVAVSAAPRGEGTPYQGLDILDVSTGAARHLTDAECLAFFWSPDAEFLVVASVDAPNNCVTWMRQPLDGGPARHLATFWPTRDVLFYLHFFDQYAQTHPIVSADGRHVVYAGYPAGGGRADLSEAPRIYVKSTADDSPPVEVANGQFATFRPAT